MTDPFLSVSVQFSGFNLGWICYHQTAFRISLVYQPAEVADLKIYIWNWVHQWREICRLHELTDSVCPTYGDLKLSSLSFRH